MFEDLGKKLGDLAQNMMKKTGELAEIASLHTKVLSKKKKADDELTALGRAYYEAHKDDINEFSERIMSINNIYNEISALEEEIRVLKEKLPTDERDAADEIVNDMAEAAEKTAAKAEEAAAEAVEETAEAAEETVEAAGEAAEENAETETEAASEAAEDTESAE